MQSKKSGVYFTPVNPETMAHPPSPLLVLHIQSGVEGSHKKVKSVWFLLNRSMQNKKSGVYFTPVNPETMAQPPSPLLASNS